MAFLDQTRDLYPETGLPGGFWKAPVGMASPLWGLFAGAALTGVTFWWATQWMRPAFAAASSALASPAEPPATPVTTLVQDVVETVVEPVLEAMSQAVSLDTAEPDEPLIAVGGEAAPMGPAVLAGAPEVVAEPPAPAAETAVHEAVDAAATEPKVRKPRTPRSAT